MACGKKKRRIKKFILDEISGVDRPCQTPALTILMKRDTLNSSNVEDEGLRIKEDENMATEQELLTQVEGLTKRLEKSEALAAMNDAQRAYHNSLPEEAQVSFRKADASTREALVKAAAAQDEEIELEGEKIRKSAVGEVYFKLLKKQADELAKARAAVKEEAEKREASELKKRAEDTLKHLPGTIEEKTAMLKAIEGIENEDMRKAAVEALKASNDKMAKAFERSSQGGSADEDTPAVKLEKMAKKHAEDKGIGYEVAYAEVCDTPEGQKLYGEI